MGPSNKENEALRVLGRVAYKVDSGEMNSQAVQGLGLVAVCSTRNGTQKELRSLCVPESSIPQVP